MNDPYIAQQVKKQVFHYQEFLSANFLERFRSVNSLHSACYTHCDTFTDARTGGDQFQYSPLIFSPAPLTLFHFCLLATRDLVAEMKGFLSKLGLMLSILFSVRHSLPPFLLPPGDPSVYPFTSVSLFPGWKLIALSLLKKAPSGDKH